MASLLGSWRYPCTVPDAAGCLHSILWGAGSSDAAPTEVAPFLGSCAGELGRNKSIAVVGVVALPLVVAILDVGGYLWPLLCCDVSPVVFEPTFLFPNLDGVCG
uniref:Uncharacterized protein n=1 Tax=Physcomitrium patens TaxID=3218 RepID=A0A2K1JHA7_PHYPA|nr:hypothetical protein PHYPA_018346 [Physcomitrium patens]